MAWVGGGVAGCTMPPYGTGVTSPLAAIWSSAPRTSSVCRRPAVASWMNGPNTPAASSRRSVPDHVQPAAAVGERRHDLMAAQRIEAGAAIVEPRAVDGERRAPRVAAVAAGHEHHARVGDRPVAAHRQRQPDAAGVIDGQRWERVGPEAGGGRPLVEGRHRARQQRHDLGVGELLAAVGGPREVDRVRLRVLGELAPGHVDVAADRIHGQRRALADVIPLLHLERIAHERLAAVAEARDVDASLVGAVAAALPIAHERRPRHEDVVAGHGLAVDAAGRARHHAHGDRLLVEEAPLAPRRDQGAAQVLDGIARFLVVVVDEPRDHDAADVAAAIEGDEPVEEQSGGTGPHDRIGRRGQALGRRGGAFRRRVLREPRHQPALPRLPTVERLVQTHPGVADLLVVGQSGQIHSAIVVRTGDEVTGIARRDCDRRLVLLLQVQVGVQPAEHVDVLPRHRGRCLRAGGQGETEDDGHDPDKVSASTAARRRRLTDMAHEGNSRHILRRRRTRRAQKCAQNFGRRRPRRERRRMMYSVSRIPASARTAIDNAKGLRYIRTYRSARPRAAGVIGAVTRGQWRAG